MVQVRGTVHDVSDSPERVERIVVRAVEPRMYGTTYITEESVQFPVVDGVLDFDVLPGPCVVAFLRNHGATTYEKLMVPDVDEATFRECLDAAALAEEGTRSALEKVVRQIQEELNKAVPLVDEVRTLHTEVSNDRTAVDGFAKAAQTSAAEAATSESNAKGSETAAGDYAAVATTAATEAVDAMGRATEIAGGDFATQSDLSNAVANVLTVDTTAGTRVLFGEHMLYGDTGWREVVPVNGWVGAIYVRRINNTIYYRGKISAETASNSNAWDIPVGFRAGNIVSSNGHGYEYGRSMVYTEETDPKMRYVSFYFSRFSIPNYNSTHVYGINLTYPTTNSWPTTLPGTPA